MAQVQLKGKLLIGAVLTVKTGLHIGDSSDFAPIGAVDSPFIRDPLTKAPIIPGSSLKGKMKKLPLKKTKVKRLSKSVRKFLLQDISINIKNQHQVKSC